MHEKKITEMKMPSDYVDMDSDEIEYDGAGTDWKRVGVILGITAVAIAAIAVTTVLLLRGGPGAQVVAGEVKVISSGPAIVPLPPI